MTGRSVPVTLAGMRTTRKLPRTIRMDSSDTNIFHLAAEPGEWAVTGTFCFMDADPDTMELKTRLTFASGWLGVESFGWSTLVQVAHADDEEYEAMVRTVAGHLFQDFGAPDMMAALDAARGVVDEAAELCASQDAGTLMSIQRDADADGIAERVRVVKQDDDMHARIWTIEDD